MGEPFPFFFFCVDGLSFLGVLRFFWGCVLLSCKVDVHTYVLILQEAEPPAVTVESTVQKFEPENWGGKMTNIIKWVYQEGPEVYNGSLTVHSTYTINSRAALVVSGRAYRNTISNKGPCFISNTDVCIFL